MWNPADPHAVIVDQQLADRLALRPGSTFRLAVIPQNPATQAAEPGHAVIVMATVTAVVAFDSQIVPATTADAAPTVLLSPPFARTALASAASYGTQLSVELRPGASMRKFRRPRRRWPSRIPACGRQAASTSQTWPTR